MITVDTWIEKLGLEPHPEGGFYREIFRSDELINKNALNGDYSGDRALYTSIYFLLNQENISLFHRLKSDEMWHFYYGSSAKIHLISDGGEYRTIILGSNIENGELPQALIPKHCWMAAEMSDKNSYILVGCTVVPGFEFADFEFGNRESLLVRFPELAEIIVRFTTQ